ncbi:MAG: hypothetical protein WDN44_02815 [Sphingomonas sp.]
MNRHVIRDLVRPWPAFGIARERAIDDVGPAASDRFEPQADPIHRAGPVVLDDHVAGGGERQGGIETGGAGQVQRNALLVAVERQEIVGHSGPWDLQALAVA